MSRGFFLHLVIGTPSSLLSFYLMIIFKQQARQFLIGVMQNRTPIIIARIATISKKIRRFVILPWDRSHHYYTYLLIIFLINGTHRLISSKFSRSRLPQFSHKIYRSCRRWIWRTHNGPKWWARGFAWLTDSSNHQNSSAFDRTWILRELMCISKILQILSIQKRSNAVINVEM